jgi:uncharacterized membrane protein YbhN (UPF0104 family)
VAPLFGLALAAVFGWLTVRKVDWGAALGAVQSARWATFSMIPLVLAITVFVRAVRWRLLLPVKAVRHIGVLYRVAGIGVGATAVLPGKMGELVSAHALGRLGKLSRVQALGIVAVSRAADLLVVSMLVVGGAVVRPDAVPESVRGTALLVLFVAGVALLLVALLPPGVRAAGKDVLGSRMKNRIGALTVKFAEGLGSVTGVAHLMRLLICTFLLWSGLALALWVATRAFGLGLTMGAAPLLLGVTTIGAIMPSAPGNVGTYHFFGVLAIGLFGVGRDAAVACIIAYHATDVLSCLLVGAVCAVLTGVSSRKSPPGPDTDRAPRTGDTRVPSQANVEPQP